MFVGGINDVLIHLVRDHKGVVFQRKLGDGFQLIPAEHLSAGVGRIAQDQRLCPFGKALFDQAQVELIRRRDQRDIDGFGSGKDGVCPVVLVERREDHHLAAGVADGHHRGHHGFGPAAGHANFRVGVHLMMEGRAGLFRQCFAEILRTKGHRVLVRALIGRFGQCVQKLLRRVKIREALREVDGIVLVVDAGHPADDRIGKRADTIAQLWHFSVLQNRRSARPAGRRRGLRQSSDRPVDSRCTAHAEGRRRKDQWCCPA